MWNLGSSNRIIDRKLKQEAHRKHILALGSMKTSINNTPPSHYSFLYSRPKANQLKFQRQNQIQVHNTILVDRMMHNSSYIRPNKQGLLKDSLNAPYRSRVERQIDSGNQKLVRRLQSAKSQYQGLDKPSQEYEKYKSNMAFSRMDPYYQLESRSVPMSRAGGRPYSAKR